MAGQRGVAGFSNRRTKRLRRPRHGDGLLSAGRPVALLGAWLIMLGGGLRAAWKLNMAISGSNVAWMSDALFVLLAPGFILMACALRFAQLSMDGRPPRASLPVVACGIAGVCMALAAGLVVVLRKRDHGRSRQRD